MKKKWREAFAFDGVQRRHASRTVRMRTRSMQQRARLRVPATRPASARLGMRAAVAHEKSARRAAPQSRRTRAGCFCMRRVSANYVLFFACADLPRLRNQERFMSASTPVSSQPLSNDAFSRGGAGRGADRAVRAHTTAKAHDIATTCARKFVAVEVANARGCFS